MTDTIDGTTEGTTPQAAPVAPFYRKVGDIIRDPAEWRDLPQVDIDLLDGSQIVVHDVMFLGGSYTREGDNDYCIILFAGPDDAPSGNVIEGRDFPMRAQTSSCGGQVFVRKMKLLAGYGPQHTGKRSDLPILGRVMRRQGDRSPAPYYDFI